MRLAYQAFDRSGRPVSAVTEAATLAEAAEALRRQGLFVTRLDQAAQAQAADPGPRAPGLRWGGAGKRLKELAAFTRQMFVLLSSGTPVLQALATVGRQIRDPAWRAVVDDLRLRVEEGASLSAAMQAHPRRFDAVVRSLVAAGEAGGSLTPMLGRLSDLNRRQLHVRSSVMGALIYPALLLSVGLGVMVLMLTVVLPRFADLFASLDVPVPVTTRGLMVVSFVLIHYWWAVLLGLIAAGAGLRWWLASPAARRAWSRLSLSLPRFGAIFRNFATARLARLLGVLLEAKVPMLEALGLTREASTNVLYAQLLASAEERVSKGEPISAAFADSPLINPSVCEALRAGEQGGQVGPVLLQVADFLDEENEVVVKSLTAIMEPLILIVLGVVVGVIAVSMFMPLFDLTALAGGGAR